MSFIRDWHEKRRLSWPVGRWKSEGMLGPVVKVEKKVRKCVAKIEQKEPYLGACDSSFLGRTPRRGFAPWAYRGCAPDPRASLQLYSVPRPAHHRMPVKMQTRVKFAALGRRWSRLKVISHGKNPRPTASGAHSRARQLAIIFGLGCSLPRSTARYHLRPRATNLALAAHSLAFASLRVISLIQTIFFPVYKFSLCRIYTSFFSNTIHKLPASQCTEKKSLVK